jgi:hypothetical protein
MDRVTGNKRGESLMIGILFYSNLLPSVTFSFFAVLIYMKTGPGRRGCSSGVQESIHGLLFCGQGPEEI